MANYMEKPKYVDFGSLYLDPNNPRLAKEDRPGYRDVNALLDKTTQDEITKILCEGDHAIKDLEAGIIGQGWLPIDTILTWVHPKHPDAQIVVEGNRRTTALRSLRSTRLPREKKKLDSMLSRKKAYSETDLAAQRDLVARIKQVIADTDQILVVPLAARNPTELSSKLNRILAVRHITGPRDWGTFAQDMWLLERYETIFKDRYPNESPRWEQGVIQEVADEASLSAVKTKRQLQASAAFSHFRAEFEDRLPKDEEFKPSDYYLFENIVRKPWLREQFSYGESDRHLPADKEEVLFEWVFSKPRGRTADDNENKWYRHENALLWDEMRRYDDDKGTSFSKRYDVDNPDDAPAMMAVQAEYCGHRAKRASTDVLEQLLAQLNSLDADALISQAAFLRPKLEQIVERAGIIVAMMKAAREGAR